MNANSFVFASLNSLKLLLPRYECYDNKGKKEQDRIVEINDDVFFFFFSRMVYPRLNNRYLAREQINRATLSRDRYNTPRFRRDLINRSTREANRVISCDQFP